MNVIVQPRWLLARLYEPDLVIIDCRFQLGAPKAGRALYEQDHIPGALYVDLEENLSGPITKHGGRHPLPDAEVFAAFIGKLGIDRNTRVVAYDDQGGAMASRLWWLMRYHGHEQTYILDGGYSTWKSLGYPVNDAKPPVIVPKTFVPHMQGQMLASRQDVYEHLHNPRTIIIDSREPRRYLGLGEPIDAMAGHIPGAVNVFWKDVLTSEGTWKSADDQRQRFEEAGISNDADKEIIVYCGSGVTACPNVLALEQAGFTKVKLYAGSWSDWISYDDSPIATSEE